MYIRLVFREISLFQLCSASGSTLITAVLKCYPAAAILLILWTHGAFSNPEMLLAFSLVCMKKEIEAVKLPVTVPLVLLLLECVGVPCALKQCAAVIVKFS